MNQTIFSKELSSNLRNSLFLYRNYKQIVLGMFVIIALTNPVHAEDLAQDPTAKPTETKPLKDIEFLGMKLIDANLNSVRSHLWDVGGFLQAKTTVKQRNIDKFFPWSTLRDSYHITFQYNHSGKVVSVRRVYRPYSIINSNKRSEITTRDVALKLIPELGQPTSTSRKGWGGGGPYQSYIWQDESMKITVDREGSEKLGNIFVEYIIKPHKRYLVIKTEEDA